MKEVIRKELETASNYGKTVWHLNYILPPSDKGNLTYLLNQAQRAERAALHDQDRRVWPAMRGRARSHSGWFSASVRAPPRRHCKRGQQPKTLCNPLLTHFTWSQKGHPLPLNTVHGPLCISCSLQRASRGNKEQDCKGLRSWAFNSEVPRGEGTVEMIFGETGNFCS